LSSALGAEQVVFVAVPGYRDDTTGAYLEPAELDAEGCRTLVESSSASGEELISDGNVDAVVIASWGQTHAGYVLASIAAGKDVFCEKPPATTADDCWGIVVAEVASDRRRIQVGFMRRYDRAYRALKEAAWGRSIGAPLLMHCTHRKPSVPDSVTTAGAYGCDIRGEVVGETGTAELATNSSAIQVTNAAGRTRKVPGDWRERFIDTYDTEFQEWIDGVAAGREPTGPTSWDGSAATVATDACNRGIPVARRSRSSCRNALSST
jgi:myo-inositol 2-dehydrogenase / D-chiro-inositol 1-dehydrogenase